MEARLERLERMERLSILAAAVRSVSANQDIAARCEKLERSIKYTWIGFTNTKSRNMWKDMKRKISEKVILYSHDGLFINGANRERLTRIDDAMEKVQAGAPRKDVIAALKGY